MKNASKNGKQVLAMMFFLFALLMQVSSGFTAAAPVTCVTCPTPDVTKTGQTSTSVSFSWAVIDGATNYKIWYFRRGDNYTSQTFTTNGTSINFSNLPAGTYQFYFSAECGEECSEALILDDLLMG